MPDSIEMVHYFHLYARSKFKKPTREYRFDDLKAAHTFVLRFVQKHVPERNAEAIWRHISFGRGEIAKVPGGFLLNFAEVGPYPARLDADEAAAARGQR